MKIDMYNGDHATDADKIRIFFIIYFFKIRR